MIDHFLNNVFQIKYKIVFYKWNFNLFYNQNKIEPEEISFLDILKLQPDKFIQCNHHLSQFTSRTEIAAIIFSKS